MDAGHLTLSASAGITRFGRGESSAGVSSALHPGAQRLHDHLVAPDHRRSLGSVNAGVGQTISPGTDIAQVWAPTGGATLTYHLVPVMITLTYGYSSQVDIYTATTRLTNQVSLRAVLPIGYTGLTLTGTGGVVHLCLSGPSGQPALGGPRLLHQRSQPRLYPSSDTQAPGQRARHLRSAIADRVPAQRRHPLWPDLQRGLRLPERARGRRGGAPGAGLHPSGPADGDTLFSQQGPAPEPRRPSTPGASRPEHAFHAGQCLPPNRPGLESGLAAAHEQERAVVFGS